MKRMLCVSLMIAVRSVIAADVTYTEPPADTAMIRVEGGTATVEGLEAYSHLTHYWSFDDKDDPYADRVGNLSLAALKDDDPEWKTGDEAKCGGAVWTANGLCAVPNFIDGRHPFTICFWYKYGDFAAAGSKGQESILHIGKKPAGKAQVDTAPYLRISHHNAGESYKIDLWCNERSYVPSALSSFVSGSWHHLALLCEVVEQEGCATSNRLTVCLNGVRTQTSCVIAQQVFASTDYFYLGAGYHWQTSMRPVADATFDEVMCFDRALTTDELNVFAAASRPVDFSAGWNVAADGMLDLYGEEPLTALKGEGVVKTVKPLQLEPTSNAWFAGSVRAPALAYAGATTVTQTLSGVNAYTGATTVESGTLEIAASPVEVFGDALVGWFPFEDATNPGRDFSPRGNHLLPGGNCVYEVTAVSTPFVGAGQNLSMNNEVQSGFHSKVDAPMDGFVEGVDNSFTVSFWMRGDAHSKDVGSFFFATSEAATGIICREESGLRVGDSGAAISCTMQEPWASGNWHHWALVYDAEAAKRIDEGATGVNCYYLFLDGICVKAVSTRNKAIQHAAGRFYLGRGFAGSGGPFKGAMDEVVVLNTANTNDVAKLYALRRTQPETATSVLPSTTALTVEEGATLKLTAVNETVAQLFGKGTIDLSGNSKLTVMTKDRFEGTVIGGVITDEPGAERRGMCILVK